MKIIEALIEEHKPDRIERNQFVPTAKYEQELLGNWKLEIEQPKSQTTPPETVAMVQKFRLYFKSYERLRAFKNELRQKYRQIAPPARAERLAPRWKIVDLRYSLGDKAVKHVVHVGFSGNHITLLAFRTDFPYSKLKPGQSMLVRQKFGINAWPNKMGKANKEKKARKRDV
jgi:hypothetical protein